MRRSQSHGNANRGLEAGAMPGLGYGRFGRMFELNPAAKVADEALAGLATAMLQPKPSQPTQIDRADPFNENPTIPAGYTYFGQFVDHDITFDPTPLTEAQMDAGALEDFRTPALDLDCIYGSGPADQPYLYEIDPVTLEQTGAVLLGAKVGSAALAEGEPPPDVATTHDVFRLADLTEAAAIVAGDFGGVLGVIGNRGTAVLGDKRNDENKIVSQVHGAVIAFHNKVVRNDALLRAAGGLDPTARIDAVERFRIAARFVRWHYQWVVVHDFLDRITMPGSVADVLNEGGAMPLIGDYLKQDAHYAYIPVEFAGAAYRFGHSMVRPGYALNRTIPGERGGDNAFSELPTFQRGSRHFSGSMNGLPGTLLPNWGIDWGFFLAGITPTKPDGAFLPQLAYRIDPSLALPLGDLPDVPVGPSDAEKRPANLAFRNLKRGQMLGLPSGEDVATALGLTPMAHDRIWDAGSKLKDARPLPGAKDQAELADRATARQALAKVFVEGETPLWYHILREAEVFGVERDPGDPAIAAGGQHLGPVGSRIVAQTFIGLLWLDKGSFLHALPRFRPHAEVFQGNARDFRLADFVRYALT